MTANEPLELGACVCASIDEALTRFQGRTLVSGTEVVDFLLDLRLVIDAETRLADLLVPVGG